MSSIIGLLGKAGSGKSTVAAYLAQNHGFKVVRFADSLKDMMRQLGLTDAHIEGDLKEVPCDLLMGKTPRQAMQWLGTEWGRNMVGENLWVNQWLNRATRHRLVVAEDVRFPNEVLTLRENGGKLIRIKRPGQHRSSATFGHTSENLLDKLDADAEVVNDGSITDLCAGVYKAAMELFS
jgi:predicted kinase